MSTGVRRTRSAVRVRAACTASVPSQPPGCAAALSTRLIYQRPGGRSTVARAEPPRSVGARAYDRRTPMAAPFPSPASLIADHAYQELRRRIVTLQLRPGTALREDQLMAELGIGRTPLREAVKRLSHESLVAIQPRRGTFVSDVDAADIVHITEVRAELEGFAAALASPPDAAPPAAQTGRDDAPREIEELGRLNDQDALMQVDERYPPLRVGGVGEPVPRSRRWSATTSSRCASGTSCSTGCRARGGRVRPGADARGDPRATGPGAVADARARAGVRARDLAAYSRS